MKSFIVFSLIVGCFVLGDLVASDVSNYQKEFNEVKNDLENAYSRMRKFEPWEVLMNLKEYKRLIELDPTINTSGKFPNYPAPVERKLDELLESWNIRESKCNRAGSVQLQVLLEYYQEYKTTIVPYLLYNKARLAKYCESLMPLSS